MLFGTVVPEVPKTLQLHSEHNIEFGYDGREFKNHDTIPEEKSSAT